MVECARCVYNDTMYPGLKFDDDGVCSACRRYEQLKEYRVKDGPDGKLELDERLESIRNRGKGREYDCIIGVSGGTDSTYVAYLTHVLGLRPLAVHLDNGWDSELAVNNIQHCLSVLEIDLETVVLDWPEFRDLQLAFLHSSTPDGEVPTDHAIQATLWKTAAKYGIHTVLSGMNFRTESPTDPEFWAYGHNDWKYIRSVHKRFGKRSKLHSFPHYSLGELLYINAVRGVRTMSLLNYVDFDKETAQGILAAELGWKPYGAKHNESIYTRFYQGYVLPRKFGIDKRYGHLSDLIRSGQTSRIAALDELSRPAYDPSEQALDREYVCKKLGLSGSEFETIMAAPTRSFQEFPNNYKRVMQMKRAANWMRKHGRYDL